LKSVIADVDTTLKILARFTDKEDWQDKNAIQQNSFHPGMKPKTKVRCHICGDVGHKSTYCQEDPISAE